MPMIFDMVAEMAAEVLAVPLSRLGWKGVVLVVLIAIGIAVIVAIAFG